MKKSIVLLFGLLFLSSVSAHALSEQPAVITSFDGVKLKGRWTLPATALRGVALILPGSGNTGADGDVSSPLIGNPYRAPSAPLSAQIAHRFAEAGIATLRLEKRGFEDPSQLPNQIVSVLIKDAKAATQAIRSRFPGKRVALVGFSEGAQIAAFVSTTENVDGLFLLGVPTRDIDSLLRYQYSEWPVELLQKKLLRNSAGEITLAEFKSQGLERFPLGHLVPALSRPLAEYDLDKNGALSIEKEIKPAYHMALGQVLGMVQGQPYAAWYNDLKALPQMEEVLPKIKARVTFIYMGLEDAQVNPAWFNQDLRHFPGLVFYRPYAGLGHCFAPMDGKIGQIKTSGPLHTSVIENIVQDSDDIFY